MKWNKLNFIFFFIASLSLTSCVQQKTNKKNSDTASTQSTILLPDESLSDEYDDEYDDGSGLPSYYDLPPVTSGPEGIIVHGTDDLGLTMPPNGKFWSSETNMSAANQQILRTDSRFNIRMMALPAPNKNTLDSNGVNCSMYPVGYKKLSVSACVRKKNGACVYMHNFSEMALNEWSPVKEFNIPSDSGEPLIIDIIDVSWDFSCTWSGQSSNCPVAGVWYKDCVRFKLQVATDGTQDLPGTRY